jgi:PAS domain S-box-containing protein
VNPPESQSDIAAILLVEDDRDVTQTVKDVLEYQGYQVTTCATGQGALTQVQRHSFSAVVLDLGLPDLDGLDVLEGLLKPDPHLPVVVLTAFTEAEQTVGAMQRGAFAYVLKPYNVQELLTTLARAIDVRRLSARVQQVERVLSTTEELFQAVIQSTPDAIVVADEEGRIAFWNSAAQRLFGYAQAEMLGKNLTLLMPLKYRPAHEAGLERLRRTRQGHLLGRTLELEAVSKDGREFPIELSLGMAVVGGRIFYSGIIRHRPRRA